MMILTGLMIRGVLVTVSSVFEGSLLDETFCCTGLEEDLVAQYTSPLCHTYAMNKILFL